MTDQVPDEFQVPRYRYWGDRKPPQNRADIFSVTSPRAAAGEASPAGNGETATLRIHGPIDSWGGFWGVSAKDVAKALDELPAGITEVRVRVNSPGGEAWEGMAILNTLRAHKAKVVAIVDGLAASAASHIVAGADERVMSPGTQLMVHDAATIAIGNAATMDRARRMLDSTSNSIASIYAAAAGGSVEDWRATMRDETWYTADEAVAAGLADRVAVVQDAGATETAGEDAVPASGDVEDRFDLSIYAHAGRSHAPAPKLPTVSAAGRPQPRKEPLVPFSDESTTTLRQKLGVAEGADEATILAALDEALNERADTSPAPTQQPAAQGPGQPAGQPGVAPASPAAPGTMVIDSSAWEEREARIKRLEAADTKRRREERDQVIDQAVRDGKFPVARKDHWARLWDADPEGTRQVIDGLTRNVVPVNELGSGVDDDGLEDEFAHLFPKGA